MLQLKYSYIGDLMPRLQPILDEFSRQNHVHIEVLQLNWEDAWPEIQRWSLGESNVKGPDISHIGSTWGASLVGVKSLRSFSAEEVNLAGGENAFLPHCWQSGLSAEKDKVWSLPWQGYTYILAYRRDLLEKAEIDEKTAFQSTQSLCDTIVKLSENISESPWVVPVSHKHLDTLHFIASWVWGAGGDFFTSNGRQAAFLEPVALDAICSYYGLLRFMTLSTNQTDNAAAQNIFLNGKAAVTIVGSGVAYNWLLTQDISPEVRENIGFAPIPGTPWVGGDNIIIWQNSLISSEHERAAVALAQHLVSLETQRSLSEFGSVPTRAAALDALPMQNTLLTDSIIYSMRSGRSYHPMNTWSKIEFEFARVFGQIGTEILSGADVATTVRKHLEIHANWLEIVFQLSFHLQR
jgi:multiple sugar transport system substrate-binding protein